MSAQTLADLETAIIAHHRDITDADEKPERAGAIVPAWVVGYEIRNIVDLGGEEGNVLGFANDYIASDTSPNLTAFLAHWAGDAIAEQINGTDQDD